MHEVYIATALQQIEVAELSAAQYRTARRLLDRAGHDGQLLLSLDEALTIAGTTALGTLRGHLIALARAGILRYSNARGALLVGFLAWPVITQRANLITPRSNVITQRANLITPRSQMEPTEPNDELNRAPDDQNRASHDQNRAPDDQICSPDDHLGGIKGGLVGWIDHSLIPSEESNQPTNPITPNLEGGPKPDPVEHALSLAMLAAAGVAPVAAKAIADAHPFALVQRAVGFWWDNREAKFKSPGIIVYWFKNLETAGIPVELSAQFRRSDLYRRHRTRAQIEADAGQVVVLRSEPPPVHRGPTVAADDPLGALWADIVATRNPSQRLYLEGARLAVLADGHAQIVADARFVGWLNAQMSKSVSRELAMRGHPASVVFVAEEVGHA